MGPTLLGGPNTFIRFSEILVRLDANFEAHFDAGMLDFIQKVLMPVQANCWYLPFWAAPVLLVQLGCS